MISGAELPGLILAVPQTVEYIVKIARAAKRWEGIDESVIFELNRVERAVEMLKLAALLIKQKPCTEELRAQLQTRLGIAVSLCKETTELIKSWDVCLGSTLKAPGLGTSCDRPHSSSSTTTYSSDPHTTSFTSGTFAVTEVALAAKHNDEGAKCGGWRHKYALVQRRTLLTAVRLLSKLACRPSITRIVDDVAGDGFLKKESAMKESTGARDSYDDSTGKAAMNSPAICPSSRLRPFHKARFLATGCVELKESIEKMQASIDALNDFIHLITILPPSLSCGDDVALFISDSKNRALNDLQVEVLDNSPEMKPIDEAESTMLSLVTSGPFEGCIVDRRPVRHLLACKRGEQAIKDSEMIAKLLSEDTQGKDLDVPVLRCCAYVKVDIFDDFHELIFRPIPESTPKTLRKLLSQENCARHPLNDRYHFALRLATSIHIFHAMGFVHGGVRPEAILVMEPPQNASELYNLGKPYLAGFNYSRSDASFSGLRTLRDVVMAEHLYHHPRHITGQTRYQAYQMSDDVYALGVCLLEIGLWRPFFVWNEDKKTYLINEEEWANVHLIRSSFVDENGDTQYNKNIWYNRRDELIRVARTELPLVMGYQYSDIVTYCLRFEDNVPAGGEGGGGDYSGSLRFIDHVLSELRRLDIPRKSKS